LKKNRHSRIDEFDPVHREFQVTILDQIPERNTKPKAKSTYERKVQVDVDISIANTRGTRCAYKRKRLKRGINSGITRTEETRFILSLGILAKG
jgi:hypothetical protein